MNYLIDFDIFLFESASDLKFNKQPKKKGSKTDRYTVTKNGVSVGQVKWSSRLRGYAFLPMEDCSSDVKSFIQKLMAKRRENKDK